MQINPDFISHLFASLFLSAAGAERRRPPPWRAAGHLLLAVVSHGSRPDSTPPSFPRAGSPLSSPRHPGHPRGRHLAVAVDSSLQSLSSPTHARLSTRSNPISFSPPCLARSLPRTPRTSPPPARTPASLKLTVAPHLQTTSARADPTNSSALSSRSSPTPPRHLFSTGATSPPFLELQPPFFSAAIALLAVDHLAPTIPDPSKHTIRCALTSSCSPVSFPSPLATNLAGIQPVNPLPSL